MGDVCNQLFLCEHSDYPPRVSKRIKKNPDLVKELKELIQKLNDRFLSPKIESMQDICRRGIVLAVCGGRHKVAAIKHILKQRPAVITHLVTDKWSAGEILGHYGNL